MIWENNNKVSHKGERNTQGIEKIRLKIILDNFWLT